MNGFSSMRVDDDTQNGLRQLFEQRAREAREELMMSLILLNIAVIVGGAFFSYFLARKTLQPIEDAMTAQAQFVSDASHELRTPLTALQVTNEVALRKKKLGLDDAKDLIQHNLAETIKLRNLSEALLGLAKQENADTSRAELNLKTVIGSVVDSLAPLAEHNDISIKQTVAKGTFVANQAAVEQILRILIDNALKYSSSNSSVTVTAKINQPGTIITISDKGIGIAPEHQAKIFDRFYRVDESRSSQNVEGNGLGLAIAHSIAQAHGYSISVQSKLGKGTSFTVHID